MSRHLGNLTVTADNIHSFPAVDEIYGHLTIAAGAELRAPRLALVRGWVTVQDEGVLHAPMLGKIDGWLTIQGEGELHAIHLLEVVQDVFLSIGEALDAPALASVGSLIVQNTATETFTMPALTDVRENITLGHLACLTAPVFATLGRSLTMKTSSRFNAPEWNYIGGYADIDETAKLSAPRFIGG